MKGRNKYGRPTEGVDEVPVRPKIKRETGMFVPTGKHVATSEQTRRRIEGGREILESQVPQFVSRTYGFKVRRPVYRLSKEARGHPEGWLHRVLQRVFKRQANRSESSTRFGKERRTNQILARLLRNSLE